MRLVNQKTGETMSATDVMQRKRYNKQKVEKKKMREREGGRERKQKIRQNYEKFSFLFF